MEQEKIERSGKIIILFGLLAFLFIPLIQNVTHIKKYEKPLEGAFYPESDTDISWLNWFSGDYQAQKDKFIKENFGLHNYYIRLICQINFSLFKKASVSYVVVGKENYLYETGYIDAYYGRDFIGQAKVDNYINKLKRIQDTLEKQNKLIFAVFAPGKACFYPEFIPDNYKSEKTISNYQAFRDAAFNKGLNHIDFYKFFQDQKIKSKYPLYPQLGIHWSNYGAILAFDSMVHYTEKKLDIALADIQLTNIELSDSLRNTDDDAIRSLNLYKNPKTFKMAYPDLKVNYDSLKHKKLRLLVISDSFWWYIYSTGLPDNIFAPARFWYYNKEMYPESFTSPVHVSEVDYAAKIREADVIIIMHAEATLHKFGGGFVDMCYDTYYKPNKRKEELQAIKEKIRSTPAWFKEVSEKAQNSGLEVDSMLTLDAIYMLDHKK
ncbi:hypothetical protein CNR22_10270 [Sphingobacteriaceae bacterium]|nr:hypothetical protein CNR22_10270 [Sphingobacteriaceae bacterium]